MKVLRFDTTQKDGTSVKVGALSGDCSVYTWCACVSVCVCALAHQFTCISTLDGPKSEDLSWVWPTYSPGMSHHSVACADHTHPQQE